MKTDSKTRFSSRVEAYIAARPRYPQNVVSHLARMIGLTPQWQVVDVGSGTGISTELFLQNGNPVTAVEPNADMRQAAERLLAHYPKFKSANASAEATTLPDASADLIIAAQAFHWFDIPATREEFARLLRPAGWTLLLWNARRLGGSPFFDAYEKLVLEYGTDYGTIRHENIGDKQLSDFFGPSGYQTAKLPNHQHLDFTGLRLRLLSSSYIPQQGDARYEPMIVQLQQIFDRYNTAGQVTIEYTTQLFYGRLA